MDDADIIAYIYPHGSGNDFERANAVITASPRRLAPRLIQPTIAEHSRQQRASTEPPEDLDASTLHYLQRLQVKFTNIPRTDKGLLFGSNPNCDVVLPYKGVSNIHFSLTFDKDNQHIIKDWNSRRGTQVTYDGDNRGARSNFQWIIGGHKLARPIRSIIITIPNIIAFQIVVPSQNIQTPDYVEKVKKFKEGCATAESLLAGMGLFPPTRSHTGVHTPGEGEIHLKTRLGHGGFGVVIHYWNWLDPEIGLFSY
ncbi:uncharacterized protein B0I36DRAFT_370180 [Microdochium trichocladiopsis]|uniref:FHA domain-containing protein n=1 Tax=Microdochium trichocladiopsis TaxID=1682393 RepID=A0A9P8XQD5_9PEZI|nr:uncharacterized protein B0I36DRAFT_370180 [Microdochium trichocladiopsis]KAH7010914.1 hypothetical protein B0I36DRAFT_370180 [Microdochium trichocladiopsis]